MKFYYFWAPSPGKIFMASSGKTAIALPPGKNPPDSIAG